MAAREAPTGRTVARVAALDHEAAEARLHDLVPDGVVAVVDRLRSRGHAAYLVGGSLRDAIRERTPVDWDLATDALPEAVVEAFESAVYENAFGTVAVRRAGETFEITTFRTEHDYADFRRPHRVEFGSDVVADLARRDFTVNAMAWGAQPAGGRYRLVDPFGGLADLGDRRLRAVGDPDARFGEDALRMVRAVRLAATLDFEIEPGTLRAIVANAELVAHLSGERIGAELTRLLAAPVPSVGLRLAEETGLLGVVSTDLAAQRGIPQNKVPGEDLWMHTLRSVDAAPADRPVVRLAALLHDIGKPATLADGRFHHHDAVGARLAEELLRRLRSPRPTIEAVTLLIRHHMFSIDPEATDAAIRRFIRRIGPEHVDGLFALRLADDAGSGKPGPDPVRDRFFERVRTELAAKPPLDRGALAVDGDDLRRELGLEPGPRMGAVLEALLDRVVADPSHNDRATLLLLAQGILADGWRDGDTGGDG